MNNISVIIPAYNEYATIQQTIDNVYAVLGNEVELIVVDQSEGDETKQICDRYPALIYLVSTGHSRSSNMNQGAAVAKGDLLLFLHADTRLPSACAEKLYTLDRTRYGRGAFHRQFTPTTRTLDVLCRGLDTWTGWRQTFLGDHTIFVFREHFNAVGGYREKPLYEDVNLSQKLRTYMRAQPLRCRYLPDKVTTSGRKFFKKGVWKTVGLILLCQTLFALGYPMEKIDRLYTRR